MVNHLHDYRWLSELPLAPGAGRLEPLALLGAIGALAALLALRSAIVVGLAFLWLRWSAFARRRRVFRLPYAEGQLGAELRAAIPVLILDAAAFSLVRWAGWLTTAPATLANTLFIFTAMFVWFEIWFYLTHRLLHTKRFYWIHRQHHVAHVVDPLSSLSFSLLERAILIVGALGFAGVAAQIWAISAPGLVAYALTNYVLNVLGHSNVEIFPARFVRSRVGRYLVTPTYHALHHARFRGHYGLFTAILDRAFGNVFPDYEAVHGAASGGAGLARTGKRVPVAGPAAERER